MNFRFLYESKMPTIDTTNNGFELYKVAHKYDVGALRTACRIQLLRSLTASNLVAYAIYGHLYNDEELKNAAISMMGREVGPLKELRSWNFLEKHPALSLEIADRIGRDRC